MSDSHQQDEGKAKPLGVLAMTLLVISAMFGGGVFNIPQNMAQSAALGAILIAWVITGVGIFTLARTFQILSAIHPEMTSGIYMYSRAGFGKLTGFLIAWGYWMSAAFGNVGYAVLLMDALNFFFPPYFKGGNTWQAITVASVIIWGLSILVMRGVKGTSVLNNIGTIAKFIPILLFIAILLFFSFHHHMLTIDFWGEAYNRALHDKPLGDIFDQIRSTMLVTLWMYIGIEGAVVMSDKSDERTVSRATILGFIIATVLFVLVSIIPFGVFSQGELATMSPPSTAAILASLVGKWGGVFINIGVIIALLSSWLVWTLLVAELPWACAKDGTFPTFFSTLNKNGVASHSLWVSTLIMQAAMLLVFFSNNAWNVMLSITGVVILPAYIGSAAFLWKVMATGKYPPKASCGRANAFITSAIATLFGIWLVYAAGLSFILVGCAIYAVGLIVFIVARKEQAPHEAVFTRWEILFALFIVIAAVVGLWMLLTGHLPQVYSMS
ncbi:basic amino acid/polyamine antiporter [Edwardsiella piscicida]|nr:basic amino acid/polyamine antiporter [Edwardsiella piscicida]ACY84771.1 amino acid transporter [Edwardsiella tarda EIB202]AOP43187.1 basic amino acid/polyamine antiporter [Edwardsiella piscicida]ARD19761.1 arginine:agmatine antiporter [Edwardsiella piscicida]EKS7765770.1 amino acid permease [Edwardsiella piscicida]EKS7780265.1 amino acid permease [Edwardsiella piscicida]